MKSQTNQRVIATIFNTDIKEDVTYLFNADDFRIPKCKNIMPAMNTKEVGMNERGYRYTVWKTNDGQLFQVYLDRSTRKI